MFHHQLIKLVMKPRSMMPPMQNGKQSMPSSKKHHPSTDSTETLSQFVLIKVPKTTQCLHM